MKKKLLLLVMVISIAAGMLYMTSFAQEQVPVHMATYTSGANADGVLSEQYLLRDGVFDVLWTKDALFVAAQTDGQVLHVTLNGSYTFTDTDLLNELQIPYEDFDFVLEDYTQTVPMTVQLGEDTIFDGLLGFGGNERLLKLTSFAGGIVVSSNNAVSAVPGGIRMQDYYAEDTANSGGGRIYQYKNELAPYADRSKTLWLEFDYSAAKMPVVTVGDPVDNAFTNWGFSLWMSHTRDVAAGFGIVNTEEGLFGVAGAKYSKAYRCFSLGRKLEDGAFHVSLGWTPDDVLLVYIDGQLVASMDDVIIYCKTAFVNNGVYFSLWRRNSAPKSPADDYDITVTNVTLGSGQGAALMDGLTLERILGGNLQADKVTQDLNLVTELDNGQLPPAALNWSSSVPAVIAPDGTVTPGTEDIDVTLTAAVAGTDQKKSFDLTVSKLTLSATIAAAQLDMDGTLSDMLWYARTPLYQCTGDNAPTGAVGALWDAENLYFGVSHKNAKTLTVTLGDKSFTLDLTTGALSGNAAEIYAVTAQTSAEIKVPFAVLGLQPSDYNQILTSIGVTLTGDGGEASLAQEPVDLCLSGNVAQKMEGFHNYCTVQLSGDTSSWDVPASGSLRMGLMNKQWMDRSRNISLLQTLHFTQLPVIDGAITHDWKQMDRYFYFFQLHPDYRAIEVSIYNAGDGKLMLRIANGLKDDSAPKAIDLGVSLGETFRLETRWLTDDSLHFYVDGQWKGSYKNADYNIQYSGSNILDMYYFSSGASASFTVSDLGVVTNACQTLANEITKDAIFGNTDLTYVTSDLTIPTAFQSAYLGTIPLEWESSDEQTISTDGRVNQPAGKAPALVELKLSVGGRKLWSVFVRVPGKAEITAAVPQIIDAAYCGSGMNINGAIAELGWNMNGTVPGTNARFGTLWDSDQLYIAFQSSAAPTAVTLAGQSVDLSAAVTSGSYTELAVSFDSLDMAITDYGVEIPAAITVDGGIWQGTIKLTGNERHDSDNSAHRVGTNTGTTGLGYTDAAHAGVSTTADGWNFFNLYDMDGNASSVGRNRLYAIFQKDNQISPALADRTTATYVEFDLRIDSMPVLAPSQAIGWDKLAPCYGFNWYFADSYFVQDDKNFSNFIGMGVFNAEDGLILAVRADEGTKLFPLNRELGDLFRLGIVWNPDGSAIVYLDGVRLAFVENAQGSIDGLGEKLISMNVWQKTAPTSRQENIDIYVSSLAVGKYYGECLLDSLTFDMIKGENTDPYDITSNLILHDTIANERIQGAALTWSSSEPDVIGHDGVLTVPEKGGKVVKMTAAQPDGKSTTIEVYVKGKVPSGKVLVVTEDRNPAVGAGEATDDYRFLFDSTANSVIAVLEESSKVNLVTLRDSDAFARLNTEVITLWVSDDNVTYTQVKGFKLLHRDNCWYLYGFEAVGKYIKVHYTILNNEENILVTDTEEASFVACPADSAITASYSSQLAGEGFPDEKTGTVTNSGQMAVYDGVWEVDGVYQQVWLDNDLLYHYIRDAKTYVRIPQLPAGGTVTLRLLSGLDSAMDLSNREAVYEVTYGTRSHTIETDAVFMRALPNGVVLGINGDEDGRLYRSFSYDGGLTWVENEEIECAYGYVNGIGGFVYDSHTGRIMFQAHMYESFDANDEANSNCQTRFIYSDDNGKTWDQLAVLQTDSNYVLSYSDGIELSCYDGSGPNVDFVLPVGAQHVGGSFCSRVGYSTDGGLTWQTSETKITLHSADSNMAESGLSEGTILEREDGTLVLYVRSQSVESRNFAMAYSYDHGLTWTQAKDSKVYTVNTQPILFRYNMSDILVWSGNNILGGNSYCRMPLSIAVSHDGMETFVDIQDLYARTYLQAMTRATRNQCNNPSVTKLAGEDTLLISWTLHHAVYEDKLIRTRVEGFTDWLYRTKGAYDSFEHGSAKYEGWSTVNGFVSVDDTHSTDGSYAMEVSVGGAAVRSVPYFNEGIVSLWLYTDDGSLSVELQSTYALEYGTGALWVSVPNPV